MTVKLLTERHLEFLSLKGGCTGSSEATLVEMPLLEIMCHGSFYFRQVIEDLKSAANVFTGDKLISIILEAIYLSQKALMQDPRQLGAQLIGRLENNKVSGRH